MRLISLLLLSAALAPLHAATATNDGRLFDLGHAMKARSERADPALDHMKRLVGEWDVAVTTGDGEALRRSKGTAEISYMNRGYAFMERRAVNSIDADGNRADVMSFLVYNPGIKQWAIGEASGYTEQIELYNGTATEGGLSLSTSVRRQGGMRLTNLRMRYAFESDDAFDVTLETSLDAENQWTTVESRHYVRRSDDATDAMPTAANYGKPTSDRLPQAAEFDFLIGEWTSHHQLLIQGNWVKFPSNNTAVYVMDGRGILEHSWHDLDPSLPDAATTILRLYNSSERRWESLYLTNRSNNLLDFGGQKEGDDIVLHGFETHRADPIQHYVFHSIKSDSYSWYGETSTDRGKTFSKFWTIDVERKPKDPS